MEEESGPIDKRQVPAENRHDETSTEYGAKRATGYPYLLDPRIERLYGIDPWGNDWGE